MRHIVARRLNGGRRNHRTRGEEFSEPLECVGIDDACVAGGGYVVEGRA